MCCMNLQEYARELVPNTLGCVVRTGSPGPFFRIAPYCTLHHTRWTRLMSFEYYPAPLSIDNSFCYSRVHTRYIHGASASARCPNRVEMYADSNSTEFFFSFPLTLVS